MIAKTKMLGLILVTAMVLTTPRLVWADNGAGDKDSWHQAGDRHHGDHHQMMAKILNLSEDQEKQLKDIKQKQKDAMKGVFEQVKSNRVAFESEIVKATPDMAKINDIQAQLKVIQSQIVDDHLNSILAIKKVLTPEQFAGYMALEKAEDLMKQHGRDNFGHKDGACKMGENHKHWGGKSDKNQDND